MLKKIVAVILNILFLAYSWLLLKYISLCLVKGSFNNGWVFGELKSVLLFITIIYVVYLFVFKIIYSRYSTLTAGIVMGLISFLIVFIVTNTAVMVRPKLSNIFYWVSIFTAFIVGFILPFSEKIIKNKIR